MGLRRQALDYGDEASQYDFETFKQYKKKNRGGLRGMWQAGAAGASTGAAIGATAGSVALPIVGTVGGGVVGGVIGGIAGGIGGAIGGNRRMKREYLKYAKEQTELGKQRADANSTEKSEADDAKKLAEERAKAAEDARKRQEYAQAQAKQLYGATTTQPIVGGEMPMYKKGGVAKMVTINIEKGELAVDPRTMKVIMDFDGAPKHPKGKDVINQKGNVQVPVGTIIIPADMRKDFLKAKPQQRIEIAAELIERQKESEGKETEETPMQEEMAMQQQMPQGQGMMAMMGGEGEGENMEEAKMGMGGYVKKYQDGTPGVVTYNKPMNVPTYNEYMQIPEGTVDYGMLTSYYATNPPQQQQSVDKTQQPWGSKVGGGGGIGAGLGAMASAIPQYFLGKKQEREAKKALAELQKQEWAKYKPTAELEQQGRDVAAARKRAEYGFTPQELGARQQQVAQAQRTAYQRARDTGLSGANQAMMAALGSQRLGALNEMAIQDARLREQKAQYADSSQRSLAQQYQALANAQTGFDIKYRLMQEQAYGQALRTGVENQYGAAANFFGGMGQTVGGVADKFIPI